MQKLTPSPRLRDGVFAWNKGSSGQSPEVFIGARFARALRPRGAWYLPILAPQLKNEKEYFLILFALRR